MTPEEKALQLRKRLLKARLAAASGAKSPAMAEGMAALSGMSKDPAAAVAAERAANRGIGQTLYDNIIGDPTDGVDSTGEWLKRGTADVVKAGAAGVARGAAGLAGLPGTIGDLGQAGVLKAGKALGIVPEDWVGTQSALSSGAMIEGMGNITGGATDYRGKTTAGKYAGTVGEFLPGAAAFGGMNPANLARFGVVPGVASEAAGQLAEGTPYETAARVAGGIAGGILPGMLAKGVAKAISPAGGADPERLKLAKVLDDFGVPITAGQRVGSEAMRRKEGLTGAGQRISEAQREAFTTAALKTAGTNATRATPEVLEETAKRIGDVFDDVTRGLDVVPDSGAITKLAGSVNEYKSLAPTGSQAPLISNILKETTKFFRGGNPVPAATVNTWRSGLSKLTTSADAATRNAAQMALEAVDDMLEGAMRAAGSPENVTRLATARGEWRNFLAIQKAATGAGENAAAGLLSPSALRNAVVQQGRASYARGGRGDLGSLARAGEGVMKQLPDSGTPAGIRAMLPGGSLSAALGAGLGGSIGGPGAAAAGAIAGAMLPGVAGAIRMTGPVQAYLANQLAGNVLARPGAGLATGLLPFSGEVRNALAPR